MNNQNAETMFDLKEAHIIQRRTLLLGAGAASALVVWHKPVVNAIVMPAHAQASVCPMIVLGNSVTGPVSGTNVPPVCSLTFDVLSGTAGMPLTITAITPQTLPADTTFTVDALGTATDVVGPRIVWRGPAAGAPFCSPFTPVVDLMFSVTATCAAVPGMGTFSQDFTISSLL